MAEGQDETRQSSASAGQVLREARERQGMSIQDAADGLNLKPRVIQAMEEDRYDLLPPRTFVKGYLRAYAKLVGVKEYDVLAAFEQQQPEPEPHRVQTAVASPEPSGIGASLKWIVVVVALAVLGYVAYNAYEPAGDQRPASDVPSAEQPREPVPAAPPSSQTEWTAPSGSSVPQSAPTAERIAPPVPDRAGNANSETTPASPSTESATADTAPEPSAAPEVREPPQEQQQAVARQQASDSDQPTSATAGLVIAVNGESWLEVQDANGVRRFSSLVQGERTIRIDGTPPFRLLVGNARDVVVRYGGEPISLQPYTRGRVARLTVPAP